MLRALMGLLLLMSMAGVAQAPATPPVATIIRAGVLVDPDSGSSAVNQTIVVQVRIAAAGSVSE